MVCWLARGELLFRQYQNTVSVMAWCLLSLFHNLKCLVVFFMHVGEVSLCLLLIKKRSFPAFLFVYLLNNIDKQISNSLKTICAVAYTYMKELSTRNSSCL